MTDDEIKLLLKAVGYDKEEEFIDWVKRFALVIIAHSSQEILDAHPLPPLSDRERTELDDFIRQGLLKP
ncbi:MAG: hypothetical protein ACPG47_02140 [Leucothrix sp.]